MSYQVKAGKLTEETFDDPPTVTGLAPATVTTPTTYSFAAYVPVGTKRIRLRHRGQHNGAVFFVGRCRRVGDAGTGAEHNFTTASGAGTGWVGPYDSDFEVELNASRQAQFWWLVNWSAGATVNTFYLLGYRMS